MNGHPLTSVDHHRDLGVMFDCYLNFHQHTSEVALKANRVLACMKRAFTDLKNNGFLKLYKAMVRPCSNRICKYNLGSTLSVG